MCWIGPKLNLSILSVPFGRPLRPLRPFGPFGPSALRPVVEGADVTGRVLKLAVPEGGASGAQQAVINRVASAAAQKGIQVVVVQVK